jgi:hypothetical protein
MNLFQNNFTQISPNFTLNTIVAVEELSNYDMIYIYHHLYVGASISLEPVTSSLKGDLRFRVFFKNFHLGYITLSNELAPIYADITAINCTISSFKKEKFLPVKALDLCLQATKIKMVS